MVTRQVRRAEVTPLDIAHDSRDQSIAKNLAAQLHRDVTEERVVVARVQRVTSGEDDIEFGIGEGERNVVGAVTTGRGLGSSRRMSA